MIDQNNLSGGFSQGLDSWTPDLNVRGGRPWWFIKSHLECSKPRGFSLLCDWNVTAVA